MQKKKIRKMALISFFLLVSNVLFAQTTPKIDLELKDATLKNFFTAIEKKTDYTFVYSNLDLTQRVSIEVKQTALDTVLKKVLIPKSITYTFDKKRIILNISKTSDKVLKRTVTGAITDMGGEPLIGASVIIKGTREGTVTNVDGNFQVLASDQDVLEISYMGYVSQQIKVKNNSHVSVQLQEDTEMLEEVVVIGYGTARKIDLTGSTSSLGGDKLKQKSSPQLSNQLQGQMAGVQITRTNGDPTQGATIRVRGITTLSENNPLVIIDGVPGNINEVAPEDVKDIQVLKDAASAAIYGSRAAAGVILITTKRAKNNEFHLSYNAEYGIDAATTKPKFANAVQWMKGINELAYNDGASSLYSAYSEELINNYMQLRSEDPDRYADTDFMELGLKSSTHHQRHSLSISGGTEKLKTNFSFGYYKSEALYDHKNYERFNVRTNNDYSISSWIHANVDVNMIYSKTVTPRNMEGSIIRDFMFRAPIYNAFWSDGRYADGKDGDNPIAKHALGGTNIGYYYRVGGKFQLDLTPVKGLTLTGIVAPRYSFDKTKDHHKKYDVYRIDGVATPGSGSATTNLSEGRNDNFSLTKQFYANYKLDINRHSIGLMAGYEDFTYKWEVLGASRTNYELNNFPYLNIGPEDYQYNSGSAGHNAYRSVFGRVMYSWADRYMLQANVRTDGSSRFAKGHRWATFPSISAGWIISEESWFKKNVVDYLKLRGSIGQLGNERIGSEFPYQAKLIYGTALLPNATTGEVDVAKTAYQMDYAFNDITWETTTTYGIGVDLGLWNSRLRVSADYYHKKTTDMLMQVGFPSYFGYNAPQNNVADMTTKGWDLELSWSDKINDLRYGVSFNLSDYRSKMGYMSDRQNIGDRHITEEGSYFNEWYGYKSLGIIVNEDDMYDERNRPIVTLTDNDKPGDIRYLDVNGDGRINASDRIRLGNSLPEWQYGGTIWAEWKNFDFNLSFQGIGHQLKYWSWPVKPFEFSAYAAPLNLIESHWSPTATDEQNAKAKYPRLTNGNGANVYADSDFYLFNGAYMRIKNITLGYSIPSNITKKFFINKLRVYFSANDLPAFSNYPKGYDPEWDRYNDLIMSSYVFGLNVSF